jgi:hypothetical protein
LRPCRAVSLVRASLCGEDSPSISNISVFSVARKDSNAEATEPSAVFVLSFRRRREHGEIVSVPASSRHITSGQWPASAPGMKKADHVGQAGS